MEYIIRKATKADCRQYFTWANDETVRKNAYHKEAIRWEDHELWFARKLDDAESRLYVVCEKDGKSMGQIRLDIDASGLAEIDYSVDAAYRGKGLGCMMLRDICDRPDPMIKEFVGEVFKANRASQMAFERAGFLRHAECVKNGEEIVVYRKIPEKRQLVIATHKSWNVKLAEEMREIYRNWYEITIVTGKEEFTRELLASLDPEYVFIPHWSYIIPEEIYANYPCVVFHMTDLPFGRGGSPLQNLIVRGIEKTRISAIRVTKGLDTGDIYLKEDLELSGTASEILQRAAGIIFHSMIPHMLEEKPQPVPQQGEIVTFKRRKPEDGEILPDMDERRIYDQIRMLDGEGYPNAFIKLGNYKLLFDQAKRDENGQVFARVRFVKGEKE